MPRYGFALLATLVTLALTPALASASGVAYPDAQWTEEWIPSPSSAGDALLHADVLRPKDATRADKTPVILSIGPYFNHSGQTGPAGPAEGTNYDPVGPNEGPSERFQDLIEGSGLLKQGYTFVMVDLRGFGGSNGCLDWSGPGEQADVVNAVKWAASQPWSTGKVGTYGKSYDALTGLIAVDHHPAGLAAVVAQEPVYDDYRYLYGDGMARENALVTPALYDGIAATPGPLTDATNYNQASLNNPDCLANNYAAQAGNNNHASDFWKARDLIPGAAGSNVPLLLTQGLTETNTAPDGLQQYLDNHTGYERAWLGIWEHVRGNERDSRGRLLMGRPGWFDEVMRFYDRFLKGEAPPVADPPIAVQTNDGNWRSEAQWPPADKSLYTTALRPGSYTDHAQSWATGSDPTGYSGVWTVSKPLPYDVHLAGSGSASVNVTTSAPNANLVVNVYDLNADGEGPMISRQGYLVRNPGEFTVPIELWSADWKLAAGHRIGVRVTDNNKEWFLFASPSGQDVEVRGGSVTLPFLRYRRTETIKGDPGVQLDDYLANTVVLPDDTLAESQVDFTLPPPLTTAPAGSVFTGGYVEPVGSSAGGGTSATGVATTTAVKPKPKAVRLVAKLTRRGRTFTVSGTAPAKALVTVKLVRGGRNVATKRVRANAKKGTFKVTFRMTRKGTYRAVVSIRSAGKTLTKRSALLRVRRNL
jgi:uncharacterized protein